LEGHKSTPHFDKIWLKKEDSDECPAETSHVQHVFGRNDNRFELTLAFLDQWLPTVLERTPRYLGVVLPAIPLSLDTQEKLARELQGLASGSVEIVLLGSAPEFSDLRRYPVVAPIPAVDPVFGAVTAARRWMPLIGWTFTTAEEFLMDGDRVKRLVETPLSEKAVHKECIELPCQIDFRTQLTTHSD
jgi:hypothetical protein